MLDAIPPLPSHCTSPCLTQKPGVGAGLVFRREAVSLPFLVKQEWHRPRHSHPGLWAPRREIAGWCRWVCGCPSQGRSGGGVDRRWRRAEPWVPWESLTCWGPIWLASQPLLPALSGGPCRALFPSQRAPQNAAIDTRNCGPFSATWKRDRLEFSRGIRCPLLKC